MHRAWKLDTPRRLFELTGASITARAHIYGRNGFIQAKPGFEVNANDHGSPFTRTIRRLRNLSCVFERSVRLCSFQGGGLLLNDGLYEPFPCGDVFTITGTSSIAINCQGLCRNIHLYSLLEPRYHRVAFITTAKDKLAADSENSQNVFMADQQYATIDCSIDSSSRSKKLVQSSKKELNHHNEASQCIEMDDSNSKVLRQQQACSPCESFQCQSTGSDFYEEVKITDDAGEPLMPRSLLDLAVDDFMHKENKQGRLLWQSFRKATALGAVSTCDFVLATWCEEGNLASWPALMYCVVVFRSWKKNKRALEVSPCPSYFVFCGKLCRMQPPTPPMCYFSPPLTLHPPNKFKSIPGGHVFTVSSTTSQISIVSHYVKAYMLTLPEPRYQYVGFIPTAKSHLLEF
ncbi:hypothetical protein L7F22_051753 [Adiantum nelumboides]|nr:hypothetical protein [Adiantum nelumboides]